MTDAIFRAAQLGLVDVEVLDELRFLNGVATRIDLLKFLGFSLVRCRFDQLLVSGSWWLGQRILGLGYTGGDSFLRSELGGSRLYKAEHRE